MIFNIIFPVAVYWFSSIDFAEIHVLKEQVLIM
jgi:hypothetical protein